jgi:Fe-S-cluster containining protein
MTNIIDINVRKVPCVDCRLQCCSKHVINVCGYDIYRIACDLGIQPTDFLAFAELTEEKPYSFKLDCSGKSYWLALNMKELPDGNRRRCCFALNLPRGQIRCGIYLSRPIACRAYPFVLVDEQVEIKHGALCHEQTWDMRQLDMNFWRGELARHDMEFSIYAFVVANWNKAADNQARPVKLDFRPYLNYVMAFYSRLDMARGLVNKEDWPGIWQQWWHFTLKGFDPLSFKDNRITDVPSWNNWLQSIKETAVEVNKQSMLPLTNLPEPEEILL